MALFDVTKALDGKRVEVAGYFGHWDRDIPVLYATRAAFEVQDGLYKSHIIFKHGIEQPKTEEMEGQLCFFEASIWYRGTIPTLDQAELIKCKG